MGCRRPRVNRSPTWRVLVQGIVNPVIVMIGNVLANRSAQMVFAQRDDVIEKLPAGATDPAFRDPVLLGCSDARALGLQTYGS